MDLNSEQAIGALNWLIIEPQELDTVCLETESFFVAWTKDIVNCSKPLA